MNVLIEYFQAGGPLMFPLCLLCFTIYLWILMLYPKLRRACAVSRKMQGLLHGLAPGEVRETVRAWAAGNPGLVARVAQYAVGGSLEGRAVRDRIAEARLAEVPPFHRELAILRGMVAAAPLLGLLGTVKGMIAGFFILSTRGAASIELLSHGISEALVTTQVGLVVALPGFAAAYAIARRLRELEVILDRFESHLMTSLSGRWAEEEA